jgi:hypothetical protein
VKESLIRVVKGVMGLAIAILTSPLWILGLIGVGYRGDRSPCKMFLEGLKAGQMKATLGPNGARLPTLFLSFPAEPPDSHVTKEDVLRIGSALMGYRHVSSEEHAQDNARNGFCFGCSLNISFCDSEQRDDRIHSRFKDLHLRVSNGEKCEGVIESYEQGITAFIERCIVMDSGEQTYGAILRTLDTTRFMVVGTNHSTARDIYHSNYGNLGRFPAEDVPANRITLLRRIRKEEINLSPQIDLTRSRSAEEMSQFRLYIASYYRRELLRFIREDFRPENFKHLSNSPRREIA